MVIEDNGKATPNHVNMQRGDDDRWSSEDGGDPSRQSWG
jgi:hypothetical protein